LELEHCIDAASDVFAADLTNVTLIATLTLIVAVTSIFGEPETVNVFLEIAVRGSL
jgi:hypothetical protein